MTEAKEDFKGVKSGAILVKGVDSSLGVKTVEYKGNNGGGDDDGNGGGMSEGELEDEEKCEDEAVTAATQGEELVTKLKASEVEAKGDTDSDAIPPLSVFVFVG